MNTIGRDELVEALLEIKHQLCAYGADINGLCDCKYGVEKGRRIGQGELGSGCCEVSLAANVIKNITKVEYQKIAKRLQRNQKIIRRTK